MRRIILATLTAAMLASTSAPGWAQGQFAPIVYVNNSAVTKYELDQRIRFMQLLRAPGADAKGARQALIDDRLKEAAAKAAGINVTDEQLDAAMAEFAGRANMDAAQFTQALGQAGVERQAYRDFVRSGVAWRELVRARIVPTVNVSDREVDQALKRVIETPIVDSVLLSELIIPAPQGQEEQALDRAEAIAASSGSEGAFAAAARQYSASASRDQGGRLNWVAIDRLPPTLQPIITALRPGQVSGPITAQGAVILFFLRDTRGQRRAGATEQSVEYLVMTVPSAQEAAQISATALSCDDVQVAANRYSPNPVQRMTAPMGQVPLDIGQRLATLDDNESTVIDYGAGARLVMLCKRQPTLVADFAPQGVPGAAANTGTPVPAVPAPGAAPVANPGGAPGAEGAPPADPSALPGRAEAREEVFNQKINTAAEAYLAELRADAIIRNPR
ncbi:MAG: peptidylprolyl isomerase [Paracoccus denitrificans]|nr:MAG: peptidylprolyl isomerase [Paracoccus denitrificans]PZO85178.1 MAG: peptidylprolyl isomerase [Paracoccus denitrificans]